MKLDRLSHEKDVMAKMIDIYCRRHHHGGSELCIDCRDLLAYAIERMECCPMGRNKTSCRRCPIHCYSPTCREQVRHVMRYVGPRMLLYHPLATIRHFYYELR